MSLKTLANTVIIITVFILLGCSANDGPDDKPTPPEVDGLFIEVSSTTLRPYEGTRIKGTLYIGDEILDVTDLMTCEPGNPRVRVTDDKFLIGITPGSSSITCRYGGYESSLQLQIEGAFPSSTRLIAGDETIHRGATTQWRFILTYPDGAERDATAYADWSIANESFATVDKGLITAIATGVTSVKASHETLLGNSQQIMIISDPPLYIEIEQNETLYIGVTRQFKAIGHWADGDRAVLSGPLIWSASNSNLELDSNRPSSGIFTAVSAGEVSVQVEYEGVAAEEEFNVLDYVVTEVVTEPLSTSSIIVGEIVFIQATAYYSNGTSEDVSGLADWNQVAVDPAVSFTTDPINNLAWLEGVRGGSATVIWADYEDVSGYSTNRYIAVQKQ